MHLAPKTVSLPSHTNSTLVLGQIKPRRAGSDNQNKGGQVRDEHD